MYRVKDYLYLYTKSLKKNLRTFTFLLRVDKIFFFKKKSNMPLPIELSIPEKKSLFFFSLQEVFHIHKYTNPFYYTLYDKRPKRRGTSSASLIMNLYEK